MKNKIYHRKKIIITECFVSSHRVNVFGKLFYHTCWINDLALSIYEHVIINNLNYFKLHSFSFNLPGKIKNMIRFSIKYKNHFLFNHLI